MRFLPLGSLICLGALGFYACNTYTPDLLGDGQSNDGGTGSVPSNGGGGMAPGGQGNGGNGPGTGGSDETGGANMGGGDTGGAGGSDSGGSPAEGGSDTTGGAGPDSGGSPPTGGTGGAPPTAGTGGMGGTGATGPVTIIDDLEDGNRQIRTGTTGRNGFWFSFLSDGATGTITDITDTTTEFPECLTGLASCTGTEAGPDALVANNLRAAHLFGTGITGNGAGFGFNFLSGTDQPYNASMFAGVRFYAKAAGGGLGQVNASFPTIDTRTNCTMCEDHFAIALNFATTWELVEIPFADLAQLGGFGVPGTTEGLTFDAENVIGMQFQTISGVGTVDVDFWVDQIEFIPAP